MHVKRREEPFVVVTVLIFEAVRLISLELAK